MVTPNETLEVKTLHLLKHKGFYCFTQIDGVRIFTKTHCSFFQRVSNQLVAALNIGTIQPSSALLDAYRSFRHHQPTADDDITKIEGDLHKAVIELIQAAGQVFIRDIRNFLVKASGFGKKFVSHFQEFDTQIYIKYMKKIRVLNDIREFSKVPIMITASEFEKIKPKGLIKKMLKYNQHYKAAQISKFLCLKQQKVAQDWACKVLKYSLEEEQYDLQARILNRLSKYSGINYIRVTEYAEQVGRKRIAYSLIEKEKSYIQKYLVNKSFKQIPAILKLREHKRAFQIACQNGDPNYINLVITHIHKENRGQLQDFLRYLISLCLPQYQRYIVQYARQIRDKKLIQTITNNRNLFSYTAFQRDLFNLTLIEYRPNLQQMAKQPNQMFSELFTSDPNFKGLIDQYLDLTRQLQIKSLPVVFEPTPRHCPHIPMTLKSKPQISINQAIYNKICRTGRTDQIKIPKSFPQRRFELIKTKFLVDVNDLGKIKFIMLDKKGKLKSKVKIGCKEIAELLIQKQRKDQLSKSLAKDLISNISNDIDKIQMFKMGEFFSEAMEVAIECRQPQLQGDIINKAPAHIRQDLMNMAQNIGVRQKK